MTQLPEISVIISAYNQPKWLEKVLWSYEFQTVKNFEVIIADDGSSEAVQKVIEQHRTKASYPITHLWQEDKGFRKTVILNKALLAAKAPYVLFTDGDCIARADFIATHLKLSADGCFLSGGYFKLSKAISDDIARQDIALQSCFDISWLKERGLGTTFKNNKLTAKGWKQRFLNFITPTKATWDGMNASGWKKDLMAVNGFDERMQYGGEDRELGERLMNMGIKAKQIRYSAICLHLYHEHAYVTEDMKSKNNQIRKVTKQRKLIRTAFGIEKL